MWLINLETPVEIPALCPVCSPDRDPETFVVAFCGEHRPDISGTADALVGEKESSISGAAEVGGEPNRIIGALIHRGGAA